MPGPAAPAPPANQPQALMSIHLGIALLGGTALFSKGVPLSALDITTWRSLLAGLFLLWLARLKWHVSLRLSGRDWALLGIAAALMAAHWVSYFHSMQVSSVATGMLALFTYPIFIVLLEPWVEGTRLKAKDLAAAGLVCAGVWLLVPGGDSSAQGDSLAGVLWGVFSGLLFAARNLLVRYRLSHLNPVLSMSRWSGAAGGRRPFEPSGQPRWPGLSRCAVRQVSRWAELASHGPQHPKARRSYHRAFGRPLPIQANS